tara:strand:+ start:881 stop:1078 length:198 start_codon:yes stop_codon:yes gene_type:complete
MPITDRITEYRDLKDNYEATFMKLKERITILEEKLKKYEDIIDKINSDNNPTWLAKYTKELLNEK